MSESHSLDSDDLRRPVDEKYRNLMNNFEAEAMSFVVRLWVEHQGEAPNSGEWRGWVHALQTGEKQYFRDLSQIAQIIQQSMGAPPGDNNSQLPGEGLDDR